MMFGKTDEKHVIGGEKIRILSERRERIKASRERDRKRFLLEFNNYFMVS